MNILPPYHKKGIATFLFLMLFCWVQWGYAQDCSIGTGTPETICDNLGTFNLAGTSSGSFLVNPSWSQIAGPTVTITDPTDLATSITGFVGGNTYTFRLSATCADTTPVFEDVDITVEPEVTSNAGMDQTLSQVTSVFLSATAPSSGIGTWGQTSGPTLVTFADANDENTQVFGMVEGAYFFEWTVSNGTCPAVSDAVGVSIEATDLELELLASTTTPDIGDVVTFTINVSNLGDVAASGVSIENLVPQGYDNIVAINNGGTFNFISQAITWTGLNVPVGTNTAVLNFTATVQTPTGTPNEFLHIAEVTFANEIDTDSSPNNDDGDQSEDDEVSLAVSPQQADLSLIKTVVGNEFTPNVGESISFEISITNSGPDDATNVVVVDQLLSGFDFDSYIATAGTYDDTTGFWQIGTVSNGATETLTIDVTVNSSGNYTNTSQVIASDGFDIDSTPANGVSSEDDQGDVTITPVNVVDLSLSKAVDNLTPNVGSNVSFTLTITNDGPSDATSVFVTDLMPSGFAYDSDDGAGDYDDATGIWDVGALASGDTESLNIIASVNPTGTYTNTAEITAHDQADIDSTPNNGLSAEDDQDEVTLNPVPIVDISITQSANDLTPNVGDQIIFTITVANDGPSEATNVVVTDFLPSGYAFVNATPSAGSYNPLIGSWLVGSLANGASETLTLIADVLPSGNYTNTAELTGLTETDVDSFPANNDGTEDDQETVAPVPVQISDLILRKFVNILSPLVGQQVIFDVNISNEGPSDVGGVEILDVLPSGYTYVSSTRTAGSYDSATGIWDLNGILPNGTTETLTIVATVNATGDYFNVAEVIASDNLDPNSIPNNTNFFENDLDSAGTTPIPAADLMLEKSVDNEFPDVLDTVTFTLTLTNEGSSDATGVVVLDELPTGYTYVSDDSGGSYNPANGAWNVGTLLNGNNMVLNIAAQVNPTGNYLNTAEVLAMVQLDPDSTPGNNDPTEDDRDEQSTTPRTVTDISITKTADNMSPSVGDEIVFTVTVNNAGPNDASGLVIEDQLATGYRFVSVTTTSGTYDAISGGWDLPNMASGTSETMEITAQVLSSGNYTNTAELIALDTFDPDSTPNNNLSSEDDQATVVPVPGGLADLSLTKIVDNASPNVGDVVRFTISVTNDGLSNATGVVIQDQLPIGFTYQSHVATNGIYDSTSGIWTLNGIIFNQDTENLEILALVNAPTGASDEYLNTAYIFASDFPDPDSDATQGVSIDDLSDGLPDDDEASVLVIPQTTDLAITKVVSNTSPAIGDEVEFTIIVVNQGGFPTTNIGIEEQLPAGYALVSANASLGVYDVDSGFWEIDLLRVSESGTLQLRVEILDVDDYLNTASLAFADQWDMDTSNDADQAFVEPTCLTIYNEFSPNGDGVNEFFKIDCISRYPNNRLQVYNRWGNIVYEQRFYNNDWDGTSNGRAIVQKGDALPVGTYYYVLDLGDGSTPRTDWLYINR
ncbi:MULTISPECIES: gliding motility-associated C-terminal domain-containing protein [Flavobacteriaceae]|uniref:T9SS type B sorting domain-containing protein n=1 Tax=Flavobacteriaceae TaxID=49546 RepID=UPI001491D8F6|nr:MULTISPECIES: gliding motility-associated C-terminal domain-containing protein [Allomuricauda]MDC6366114.1 gliding motility-associated C-terminal domain-containing protein [Muricauda sp. AC10]